MGSGCHCLWFGVCRRVVRVCVPLAFAPDSHPNNHTLKDLNCTRKNVQFRIFSLIRGQLESDIQLSLSSVGLLPWQGPIKRVLVSAVMLSIEPLLLSAKSATLQHVKKPERLRNSRRACSSRPSGVANGSPHGSMWTLVDMFSCVRRPCHMLSTPTS